MIIVIPSFRDWIGQWHCKHGRHKWEEETLFGHTRWCPRCGAYQREVDGEWIDA